MKIRSSFTLGIVLLLERHLILWVWLTYNFTRLLFISSSYWFLFICRTLWSKQDRCSYQCQSGRPATVVEREAQETSHGSKHHSISTNIYQNYRTKRSSYIQRMNFLSGNQIEDCIVLFYHSDHTFAINFFHTSDFGVTSRNRISSGTISKQEIEGKLGSNIWLSEVSRWKY